MLNLFIARSAIVGLLIPLLFHFLWYEIRIEELISRDCYSLFLDLQLIIWPSSIMLLGASNELEVYIITLISTVANTIYYIAIGLVAWIGIYKYRTVLILLVIALCGLWWRMLSL